MGETDQNHEPRAVEPQTVVGAADTAAAPRRSGVSTATSSSRASSSFFMDVSSEMVYSLVPIFLSSVLGVNKSLIGVIEGIAETTASMLKMFAGWLSDRLGRRKPLMLFGYSISTLSRPLWLWRAVGGWCSGRASSTGSARGAHGSSGRYRRRLVREARTGPLLRLSPGDGPVRGGHGPGHRVPGAQPAARALSHGLLDLDDPGILCVAGDRVLHPRRRPRRTAVIDLTGWTAVARREPAGCGRRDRRPANGAPERVSRSRLRGGEDAAPAPPAPRLPAGHRHLLSGQLAPTPF